MTKEDIRKKKAQIKKTHAKITKAISKIKLLENKIFNKLFFHSGIDKKKLYEMINGSFNRCDDSTKDEQESFADLELFLSRNGATISTLKSNVIQFVIDYHIDLFGNEISYYVDYIDCQNPEDILLLSILESKHITKNQILEISNFFKVLSKEHLNYLTYSSTSILGFINTVSVLTK